MNFPLHSLPSVSTECSQQACYYLLITLFILYFQSILNAAKKLAFMITQSQYKGDLDGSIPVLIQSVSNYTRYQLKTIWDINNKS